MVPLSQILTRVRTLYEAEAGASSVRWSDTDVTAFINESLECLAEGSGFYERYVTVPVQTNRTYYDLRGFTPETVVSVRSIWSTARNDWLKPISPEELDVNWETATGDPLCYWTRGIYWIGVYPKGDSTSGYLRVNFAGVPSQFTHPQAVLGDLPDNYVPALEDYVLYELSALDARPKSALLHFASYQKREKALAEFMDRRLVASTAGRFGRLMGRI
jgi:hypothetical protein